MPIYSPPKLNFSVTDMIIPACSTKNMATILTALNAASAKVAFIGHSITEGENENWRQSGGMVNVIKRSLSAAFPSVAFNFCNFGLGGSVASQYGSAANIVDTTGYVAVGSSGAVTSTSFYRPANTATFVCRSWLSDDGTVNGATVGKSWRNHVLDFAPDLVFVNFDLNDTSLASYKTAIQFIIDDFNNNLDWVAKRPSIVLIASHTGDGTNPPLVRQLSRCLRGLSRANNLPLIDGARIYDILTTGKDPLSRQVSGEGYFRYNGAYNSSVAFVLNTNYWANVTGTGGGLNSVADLGGVTLRALRKRACADISIGGLVFCYSTGAVPQLYYRADPSSLVSTASRYIVQIAGSTVSLIYQATGGGQTTIATGSVTAMTSSSSYRLDVDVRGARHVVRVNGIVKIDVMDYSDFTEGYAGIGCTGTNGTVGWSRGTATNNQFYIEYLDPATINNPAFSNKDLVGYVNDFATNPDSLGGNTTLHLTTFGYEQVYTPAVAIFIRQAQAVFA